MSNKKQSLRDTLKEFENLQSNVVFKDIDDDDITGAKIPDKYDEEDNASSGNELKNYGNLRKRNFISQDELDSKYYGSATSRKLLKEWDDSDDNEGSDNDDDVNTSNDDSTHSNDEMHENEKPDDSSVSGDMMSDENNASDDDDDDEMDDGTMMDIDFSKLPDDLKVSISAKKNQSNSSEDDDEGVANFNDAKMNQEIEKGKATKSQIEIWDGLLELRIKMQKLLQLTNRYPQHDSLKLFVKNSNKETISSVNAGKKMLKDYLKKLLDIQATLLSQNEETKEMLSGTQKPISKHNDDDEEIPSDTDEDIESESENEESSKNENKLNLPSKRKNTLSTKDFEEEINKRHSAYQPYKENIINKWYDKTRLVSTRLNNKGFSAFEKSTLQQIKQVLSDKPRLVKRTQLRRAPYDILGKPKDKIIENKASELVDSHLQDNDENIFDDSDFYHELLKELIERKSNINPDDPITAGRQWLEIQKLRTKVKRKVDTRASKGRKVRYDVHQKLVSFMAPDQIGTFSDQARNDLFASLFSNVGTQPAR